MDLLVYLTCSRGAGANIAVGRMEKKAGNLSIASRNWKQVGVAAWLECWLSHLGVAGSSPGRDNL